MVVVCTEEALDRPLRRAFAAAPNPDRVDVRDAEIYRAHTRRALLSYLRGMRCYPGTKSRKTRLFAILRRKCRQLEYGASNASAVRRLQRFARAIGERSARHRRGPALHDRGLCANRVDLVTTVPVGDIPDRDFISVSDPASGVVHGFDAETLARVIDRFGGKNPYTRVSLPPHVADDCRFLITSHSRFGASYFECPPAFLPSRPSPPGTGRRGRENPGGASSALRRTQSLRRRAYAAMALVRSASADPAGLPSAEWLLSLSPGAVIDLYERLRRRVRSLSRPSRRRLLPGLPLRRVFPRAAAWYRRHDDASVRNCLLGVVEAIAGRADTSGGRARGALLVARAFADSRRTAEEEADPGIAAPPRPRPPENSASPPDLTAGRTLTAHTTGPGPA